MSGPSIDKKSIRRRVAALTGTTMLAVLLVVPCAAMFAAVESDAHACCDHHDGHSSMPSSQDCERLCAATASTLPPQSAAPEAGVGVVTGVDQAATAIAPTSLRLTAMHLAAPDPPPLFVLHCAFLI